MHSTENEIKQRPPQHSFELWRWGETEMVEKVPPSNKTWVALRTFVFRLFSSHSTVGRVAVISREAPNYCCRSSFDQPLPGVPLVSLTTPPISLVPHAYTYFAFLLLLLLYTSSATHHYVSNRPCTYTHYSSRQHTHTLSQPFSFWYINTRKV